MISQKLIDEFKRIYKEDYGIVLTDSQASEASNTLVNYFSILIDIDQKSKQNEENK